MHACMHGCTHAEIDIDNIILQSPGRRFYQRYASSGPLFNKDVPQAKGQMVMTKTSYQQQLQSNKTRARERDERCFFLLLLNIINKPLATLLLNITSRP